MAYKLHYEMGLTHSQAAKRITTELKLGKPVRRWEVSRWMKQVKNWHIRTGLPVPSIPERGNKASPLLVNDRPCRGHYCS